MGEVAQYPRENELGCGLIGGIFTRRRFWPRNTPVHSLPVDSSSNNIMKVPSTDTSKKPPTHTSKKQKSQSETSAFLDTSSLDKAIPKQGQKHTRRHNLVPPIPSTTPHQKSEGRRHSDAARSFTSSSSLGLRKRPQNNDSRELISKTVTSNHQPSSDNSKALVRSTSGNVMLLGHLGNLRQLGDGSAVGKNSPNATMKTVDYLHRNLQEVNYSPRLQNGLSKLGGNVVLGNIVKQPSGNPEVLKNMGNEKYKQGRFEEALALYDRAIALDSSKATYRNNRSAALLGLGRLVEAVSDCKEAIKLDPSYQRAHHRLATLYVRLGEAEKALYHYNLSGPNTDSKDIAQVQALQKHMNRCMEARKSRDWNAVLKETEHAIWYGADSAPQVYVMRAEALLRIQRHEEAYAAYQKILDFPVDFCTKLFGLAATCHLVMIEAQIYMAVGRIEDAVNVAKKAAKLDPSNKEAGTVVTTVKAVASARLSGNLLFKASKFSEACVVYNEGLEHDPFNSILLCNRAACRSKLGQFEKAVEDCTAALSMQPSYSKARLRRADCNAKLGRWEASIRDYEVLIRESPGDEEVGRALFEAQIQLKRLRGEDTEGLKFGSNLVLISSNERFRHFVTSPDMSVVLFCNKANHKQGLRLMEQVCKRFPSVNFLKVEVEDHAYIAISEGVTSGPCFKIYKNGSSVTEIPGNNRELLEKSVKLYSS